MADIRSVEESILFEVGSMLWVVGSIRVDVLLMRRTLVLGSLFFGENELMVVTLLRWNLLRTKIRRWLVFNLKSLQASGFHFPASYLLFPYVKKEMKTPLRKLIIFISAPVNKCSVLYYRCPEIHFVLKIDDFFYLPNI